ncbi:hypothetical protein J2X01_003456 [Arthrobacter ginsengisoli]|uniref:Glyoxalase-like domain-containing protein n=1 Tax=Arthrobacter ginsengisoli TaxID=1356565 RepID=A0ABU1UG34_9MICC|nr:hypothetical protein [Arthrobacter ginsengisoli]MDR7084148.1 hypothetical protein [Arthrobacter ginsengisoli]
MPQGLDTAIRHFVLTTENIARTSGELHEWLGVGQGQTHSYTLEYGFVNEIVMLGTSFVELGQPIWAGHRLHGVLEDRGGDCAQMIVLETDDAVALRERALARNFTLVKDKEFQGQKVLQFDPEVFGTRFETYEYHLPDGWWTGRPENYTPSTVVEDVLGADIAVGHPAQTAARIAEVYRAKLDADGTSVHFGDKTLHFVPADGGWEGLTALNLAALDPARRGDSRTICGTEFRFV